MARPQGGLGRGIGALIPPADPRSKSNDDGSQRDELRQRPATDGYVEIPLEAIAVNQSQPRNCLLYTSPSPRDRTRSRMPSSA